MNFSDNRCKEYLASTVSGRKQDVASTTLLLRPHQWLSTMASSCLQLVLLQFNFCQVNGKPKKENKYEFENFSRDF